MVGNALRDIHMMTAHQQYHLTPPTHLPPRSLSPHLSMHIGGYSKHIVVHKDFAVIIPKNIDLAAATPLLCAGKAPYPRLS